MRGQRSDIDAAFARFCEVFEVTEHGAKLTRHGAHWTLTLTRVERHTADGVTKGVWVAGPIPRHQMVAALAIMAELRAFLLFPLPTVSLPANHVPHALAILPLADVLPPLAADCDDPGPE